MSNPKVYGSLIARVYAHRRALINEGKTMFNTKTLEPDTQRLANQEMKIESATKFLNNKS